MVISSLSWLVNEKKGSDRSKRKAVLLRGAYEGLGGLDGLHSK